MCGIFGYVGSRTASPILLAGLRMLEYRGYDSAGVFVPGNPVVKAVGPIDALAEKLPTQLSGTSGIAHTRWATHGEPTERNAHPHNDANGSIWLVHNGIIENYQEIRDGLRRQGITFSSTTDTEVLAKLIGTLYDGDLVAAVQKALVVVRGAYGLAVMSERDKDSIVVARLGSPIVLGFGVDGNFVSSDPAALLTHTKDVVYLEDGEIALLQQDSYEVQTIAGKKRQKQKEVIAGDYSAVQKGGYEHFMQKEIFEAPTVIKNTLRGRLHAGKGKAKLGGLEEMHDTLHDLTRLQIVGCGSAYYAGAVGRYLLEEYAGVPVEIELASEYRYKHVLPSDHSAVLAVSQSGETADTLASLKKAKQLGVPTFGVVNVVGSSIARATDAGVYNHAGPEVAVASTKAFISQLTVLTLLTLFIGRERTLSQKAGELMVIGLQQLPDDLAAVLKSSGQIERVAKKYAHYKDMMYIGRKLHAPIAYEGALKLKEVAYIHAEAYAGGELKHGPIAMLDSDFPVLALAPEDDVYEKMLTNVEEVKARQAPVIVVVTKGDTKASAIADDVIEVPKVHPALQPIVTTVALHLFAYYIGVAKGLNVDRPRNLAKSVTVE